MSESEATAAGDDVNWDAVSHVVSSAYRISVVDELADGPATPSQIADATTDDLAHISRALQSLRDEGVVDLLVSDDRKKGRLYGLTETGERAAEHLEERGHV